MVEVTDQKNLEGPWIGIDLGTTNSCAAFWRNGKVEIVPDEGGANTIPSVVSYTSYTNEVLVGRAAINKKVKNYSNCIYDSKCLLGKTFDDQTIDTYRKCWPFDIVKSRNDKPKVKFNVLGVDKVLSPEQISAKILECLKNNAERHLGSTVSKCVVTVPAYFSDM